MPGSSKIPALIVIAFGAIMLFSALAYFFSPGGIGKPFATDKERNIAFAFEAFVGWFLLRIGCRALKSDPKKPSS